MTDKLVILSTCASEAEAATLAGLLIERRLAACVNVVAGVRSFYRWQGKVESGQEALLVIKSSRGRFAELRAAIEQAHSYDVPEIIALPIEDGAAPYLAWMQENLENA
ncbi:MAG TPA: divalent-cation tolerance protein CutA [Bryobacteraceae bacterium]|jgi:periplasmic divalent cation tolerance protein|nr:divalent-cation tolerance protein CutA [Bryobacteraceae bacterium]